MTHIFKNRWGVNVLQYQVGTSGTSCSTMRNITSREINSEKLKLHKKGKTFTKQSGYETGVCPPSFVSQSG